MIVAASIFGPDVPCADSCVSHRIISVFPDDPDPPGCQPLFPSFRPVDALLSASMAIRVMRANRSSPRGSRLSAFSPVADIASASRLHSAFPRRLRRRPAAVAIIKSLWNGQKSDLHDGLPKCGRGRSCSGDAMIFQLRHIATNAAHRCN
jgi:hypothetical protein